MQTRLITHDQTKIASVPVCNVGVWLLSIRKQARLASSAHPPLAVVELKRSLVEQDLVPRLAVYTKYSWVALDILCFGQAAVKASRNSSFHANTTTTQPAAKVTSVAATAASACRHEQT